MAAKNKPPDRIGEVLGQRYELVDVIGNMPLVRAFGAVGGMLGLNQLPRHHHPVFESDRFRKASDDRFFISIEASDPRFDVDRTRSLLEGAHASHVEVLEEDVW